MLAVKIHCIFLDATLLIMSLISCYYCYSKHTLRSFLSIFVSFLESHQHYSNLHFYLLSRISPPTGCLNLIWNNSFEVQNGQLKWLPSSKKSSSTFERWGHLSFINILYKKSNIGWPQQPPPLFISTVFLKYPVSLDNFSISKFSVWEYKNSISVLTWFL